MSIEVQTEAEADIERLLDHLDRWLLQQPEWLRLMALPARQTRKRVAELVAKELLLMPKRPDQGQPGRQMRRKILAEMKKDESSWMKGVH